MARNEIDKLLQETDELIAESAANFADVSPGLC